jgi:hypothetical protein
VKTSFQQLKTGLKIRSFTQQSTPAAVFVLPTPTLDCSGVAHLAEHLTFRYSQSYPQPHTLFTVNTLWPVKINASSQNGFSYFYITATHEDYLLPCIHYLYCGLITHQYKDSDIQIERDGVIFRELAMYEAAPEYASLMAIYRGDNSPHSLGHWGGFTDTIGRVSQQDIQAYKQQYYQPQYISLLISGVNENLLTSICHTLETSPIPHHPDAHYFPQVNSFQQAEEQAQEIVSWWLPQAYHTYLQDQEEAINALASQHQYTLHIDNDINGKGEFALRLYGSAKIDKIIQDQIQQQVITLLDLAPRDPKPQLFNEPKYPAQINQMLAWFHTHRQSTITCAPTVTMVPMITQAAELPSLSGFPPLPPWMNKYDGCKLLNHGEVPQALVSPPLPKRVELLRKKYPPQRAVIVEQYDWILTFDISRLSSRQRRKLIIQLAQQDTTWAPRLSGECYAQGMSFDSELLTLWGVMDTSSANRPRQFTQIVGQQLDSIG